MGISLASDIKEIVSLHKQCVEHEMTINNLQEEKESMKEFYKEKIMVLEAQISDLKKYNGISLRDHFAGLAMQGLINDTDYRQNADSAELTTIAYFYADRMIQSRKHKTCLAI